MPGWCNGSAGFVHTFLLAHACLGDPVFLDVARRGGEDAWSQETGAWNLCCGAAGRAYSMLALWRQTGERAWQRRGRALAARAVAGAEASFAEAGPGGSEGLMRGSAGVAVLVADLVAEGGAAMPFMERDGWATRPRAPGAAHA
jgi:serine/threonine-protein kinase